MDALSVPVRQGSPEWAVARRSGIGGSDAPAVIGVSLYRSPYLLWAEKLGLVPAMTESEPMRWGRLLEAVVAQAYAERTGRRLRRVRRLLRSRARPWMLASIDRAVVGEQRLVEIKTTRSPRWDGADPVPPDVLCQVQHYLAVTGWDVGDVAVLLAGSDLRILEVPRDEAHIQELVEREAEFWHLIESRTPPPLDGSEATRRALSHLHPGDDGSQLAASADTDRLLAQLQVARRRLDAAERDEAAVENSLRAAMGDAALLIGPGYRVSFRKSADSLRVDWQAVAAELKPDPSLVARFTTAREGPRVLRVRFGANAPSELGGRDVAA